MHFLNALQAAAARYFGWSREAQAAEVLKNLGTLYGRKNSDDLLFTLLVVINQYAAKVPAVASTTKGAPALAAIGNPCSAGLALSDTVVKACI